MPIFRVKSVKNLHRPKKIYTSAARGARDKYEVWVRQIPNLAKAIPEKEIDSKFGLRLFEIYERLKVKKNPRKGHKFQRVTKISTRFRIHQKVADFPMTQNFCLKSARCDGFPKVEIETPCFKIITTSFVK